MKKLLIATVAGALLGVIGSKFIFVGSWLSLIPWTIAGLAVGAYSEDLKEALQNGGAYGFVLSFVFLATGYAGSAPIVSRVPFFILLGLIGLVGGVLLGFFGYMGRQLLAKQSDSDSNTLQ